MIREGRYCLRPNFKCHFAGIPTRYPGRRQWIRVVFIGHPAVLGTKYVLPSSLSFSGVLGRRCRPPCGYFVGPVCRAAVSPRLFQSTTVPRGVCGWYVGTYLFCFLSWAFLFLFVRRFLGRSRVFRGFRLFCGFPVLSESRLQFPAEETGWKPSHLGCPRVPASRQLAHPGSKPSHLGCPRVSASRQMAHPGWKPCHLEAGPNTTNYEQRLIRNQTVPPPPRGIPSP